jgi:hypothetical protein
LKIYFSEPVVANSGNLYFTDVTDNVTDSGKVHSSIISISGNLVTINATLQPLKHYAVGIDAGAFTDFSNNPYAGKTATNWQFSTASNDPIPPIITSLLPANGATNAPIKPNFSVKFNEGVALGLGAIHIKQVSNDSLVQLIWLNTATVKDSTIHFSAIENLKFSTKY